jgi:hypothetical protein
MSDNELLEALRSATVGGSQIDPLFWDKFAQLCRQGQAENQEIPSVADIRRFVQINSITVPAAWKYQLMDVLYKRLQIEETAEYLAVATQAELETIEFERSLEDRQAISFIYKDPLRFKRVRRMFAVNDKAFFADTLPKNRLALLRQQCRLGVDLRVYVVKKDDTVPNFGIYGNIAVGRMLANPSASTADDSNEVSFSRVKVAAAREEFNHYFRFADPLLTVLRRPRKIR